MSFLTQDLSSGSNNVYRLLLVIGRQSISAPHLIDQTLRWRRRALDLRNKNRQ